MNMEVLPAVVSKDELVLPDRKTLTDRFKQIKEFQKIVQQELHDGVDYGVPYYGAKQKTLLKPGAEKISKMLGLSERYTELKVVENFDEPPFFYYKVLCQLLIPATNIVIAECIGSCNSHEVKYKYRWLNQFDLKEIGGNPESHRPRKLMKKGNGQWYVYRIDNDQIADQANTILKMAEKRAFVGATISAGRLGNLFSQDLEDLPPLEPEDVPPPDSNGQPKAKEPERSSQPVQKPEAKSKAKPEAKKAEFVQPDHFEPIPPPTDQDAPPEHAHGQPDQPELKILNALGRIDQDKAMACPCGEKLDAKQRQFYLERPELKETVCFVCATLRKQGKSYGKNRRNG